MRHNAEINEQKTQSLFLFCETFNLEASGIDLLKPYVFVRPGGASKVPFSD